MELHASVALIIHNNRLLGRPIRPKWSSAVQATFENRVEFLKGHEVVKSRAHDARSEFEYTINGAGVSSVLCGETGRQTFRIESREHQVEY